MEYQALTLWLDESLCECLSKQFQGQLDFVVAWGIADMGRLLEKRAFHLLLVDLSALIAVQREKLVEMMRRVSYAPIVILLKEAAEYELCHLVDLGADLCLSRGQSPTLMASQIFAQFRRYTSYNHYDGLSGTEIAPFQCGDILIDPLRYHIQVRGRNVELCPREFSLLLLLMKNPGIVLTPEQICEYAWGNEGSYGRGVSGPIALLRKVIEPDPRHPIYIETVRGVGYRFIAETDETCDNRSEIEVIL